MTPERRNQQAKALAKNDYLRFLLDERADEIRDEWETTEASDAETRELKYQELRTLTELKDFIYARISADAAGDGSATK